MRKDFLNGDYAEKEVVLTIRVPKDFDHDDERMLDDEIANLLFKQGWELVDSKEYRDVDHASLQPQFAVDHLLKFIEQEVPFRMKEIHGLDVTPDVMASLIESLKDHNDVMFDYDALDSWLLEQYEELVPSRDVPEPTPDEVGLPREDTVWICVYRDCLGFGDDYDNLTEIMVPTVWLAEQLKREGQYTAGWFDEYTADATDNLARVALQEGKILDCSTPEIKAALLEQPEWFFALDEIDQDCVQQYTYLLGRTLVSEEEYKEIDSQVDEMILEWETPEKFFKDYPELVKYAAEPEKYIPAKNADHEQLIGTYVDYNGYYCEVIDVENGTVFLQSSNDDMHFEISMTAFEQEATPVTDMDDRFPLQNYDEAVDYLRELLNARIQEMDFDDVRKPLLTIDNFIPLFKSDNYFGIYCYDDLGENQYYLVNRNDGEHQMVLGDSFVFAGENMLDCLKDENILHVANTEFTTYLVDFSRNNVEGIVPIEELGGLANLQTALREAKVRETGGYFPGPSLADKIKEAAGRKESGMHESVVSVAHFAENAEVKKAVLQSDALRNEVLNRCYGIPGYASLPLEDKNKLYDLVKKAATAGHEMGTKPTPERG